MASVKSIHSIVLDAGPILRNEPPVSSLLAQSETLFSVPSVINEIRDAAARSRLETTLLPFLVLRSPEDQSVKIITDFARRTGDLNVLSKPDIQILALAYELECERNGGNWRLRSVPGQKRLNGAPPRPVERSPLNLKDQAPELSTELNTSEKVPDVKVEPTPIDANPALEQSEALEEANQDDYPTSGTKEVQTTEQVSELSLYSLALEPISTSHTPEAQRGSLVSDDSDSEGWITPSNFKKHQSADLKAAGAPSSSTGLMQVATITTDFAMQNVLLQMNLNLLSPSLRRIRHLKTYILRCHACFQQTKEMDKQFCPRCGKPTLMRVACSTMHNGEFQVHLKKNMQWNTRGDRYSIPKPVSGSANGKVTHGGGSKGWGQGLILAEDQKEYVQAMQVKGRRKERNLMDEDYLPSILTGDRHRLGGRIKVGAGRTINSRKR
ncbi:Nin1 binding protein [Acarospora aff. strigata]|nr:Nin1 binding protein [Acarospora aff. strigata]